MRYAFEILETVVERGLATLTDAERAQLRKSIRRDDVGNVRLAPAERDSMARILAYRLFPPTANREG